MKLFYADASPYARIVRVFLLETGLDGGVEKQVVTLRDPASALLPFNPVGRVPSLQVDGGAVLCETLLILSYLDTRHDGPKRLPHDGSDGWRGMADTGRAIAMLDGIALWNREMRRPTDERSPGLIAVETTRAGRTADALEAMVGAGGYAGGDDAAALSLACTLGYCERRHTMWKWREGRPKLAAWYDRMAQRPSLQATVPALSGL